MLDRIKSYLSGREETLLDKSKEDHLAKKQEAEQTLKQLREQRDELKEALTKKKQQYTQEKEAGKEAKADDHLKDAKEIEQKLNTIKGRINETAKQRNLTSNLANIHDITASHDDEYWQMLKTMDEEKLLEQLGKAQYEVEEMMDVLKTGGSATESTIETYLTQSDTIHQDADLEAEFRDESAGTESRINPDKIFEDTLDTIDADEADENTDDEELMR